MKLFFHLTIAALFVLTSCNESADPKNVSIPKDPIPAKKDSAVIQPLPPEKIMDTIFAAERDTAFDISHGSIYVVGYSKPASPRKYTVHAKAGETITGTIKALKKNGNVRIAQLQYPDKSFDGPFGDSASYTMPRNGDLSFIIGQNMMAGDPWKGEFVLFISKKK